MFHRLWPTPDRLIAEEISFDQKQYRIECGGKFEKSLLAEAHLRRRATPANENGVNGLPMISINFALESS
jgi:hypothetical protein